MRARGRHCGGALRTIGPPSPRHCCDVCQMVHLKSLLDGAAVRCLFSCGDREGAMLRSPPAALHVMAVHQNMRVPIGLIRKLGPDMRHGCVFDGSWWGVHNTLCCD